ncbi:phosphonate ABC transporter, permease protein PhnE [Roseinatronobacter bogoriensis]|uniref:Phosphonate ABC transporter, permease protein PhnE n=1 Tax=Roseinatronobacter bogoriensis subsp. barguzinensis TaxID=441209 RepID=A0A2K8KAV6_9RHOB|nr:MULTISPECIES: phosphonate ABC transporter, permease protein PhnE [Rhodobaca]ATX64825.1 phosphonate ABC transporter, permease protein PhnE [Rhodobaca barguzinensis]MBB4208615.1 phosphonate transport system permease protein [Rhodobaca bogoriensis DSM 18756]TDW38117.1 phosphonate transport system permease protein [Rhodobaca barguzinensis]TDY69713.1 phosphonate transport system permease protein [Rhodobaca bogoriensis DSM 18756]
MASVTTNGQDRDPVSLFETHRRQMIRDRMVVNITLGVAFLGFLLWSLWISRFTPDRLATGLPRIFEYFGSVMPTLQWDVLFDGRNEAGRFPPGSIGYWYNDFWKYMRLIWETILMALTATILGTGLAVALSFIAARNCAPFPWAGVLARRFLEFCRGVPEILFALVLVFAVGIGPLAGVLAITIHATGALGKLFSEVNENASMRPVDGIKAVGGSWFEQMRYGVLPQVLPNFTSYALWRFEINVRASAVVGFVGAGGIGAELSHTISFYSDDRVTAVLLLVVLTVTAIDLLSERARHSLIGKESLK